MTSPQMTPEADAMTSPVVKEWHVRFDKARFWQSWPKSWPWCIVWPSGGRSEYAPDVNSAWSDAKELAKEYRGRAILHRKDGSIRTTRDYSK